MVGMALVGTCSGRLLQGNWESWLAPSVKNKFVNMGFWSVNVGVGLCVGIGRACPAFL
jgi:hypothetical protein